MPVNYNLASQAIQLLIDDVLSCFKALSLKREVVNGRCMFNATRGVDGGSYHFIRTIEDKEHVSTQITETSYTTLVSKIELCFFTHDYRYKYCDPATTFCTIDFKINATNHKSLTSPSVLLIKDQSTTLNPKYSFWQAHHSCNAVYLTEHNWAKQITNHIHYALDYKVYSQYVAVGTNRKNIQFMIDHIERIGSP